MLTFFWILEIKATRCDRRGLELDDGRPVLGKTRDARLKLLENFNSWLTEVGVALDDLLQPTISGH